VIPMGEPAKQNVPINWDNLFFLNPLGQ